MASPNAVHLGHIPNSRSASFRILVSDSEHVRVSHFQLFCTVQTAPQQTLAQTYYLAHMK